MHIADILAQFDDINRKGFYFHHIVTALQQLSEEEKAQGPFSFEVLAFNLTSCPSDNPWGDFCYGPTATWKNEAGNICHIPAYESITPDAVRYWERRVEETNNPLLKMRYAGLVWDFKFKVVGEKHSGDLFRTYVDSMLKVCDEDYPDHPAISVAILERLWHLTLNQENYRDAVKQVALDFERRHATDETKQYWSFRFRMMIDNRKYFSEAEQQALLTEHEERLRRFATPDEQGRQNPWRIQDQAELLAEYYNSLQQKEDVRRVLNLVEQAFVHEREQISGLQYTANIKHLSDTYYHYQLHDDAKRIAIEIQNAGDKVLGDMKQYQQKVTIPRDCIDAMDKVYGGSPELTDEKICRLIFEHIPLKSNEEDSLMETAKRHPLMFIGQTVQTDHKGRPLFITKSLEEDKEGHLLLHYSSNLQMDTQWLGWAVSRLYQSGALNEDSVMEMVVNPCPLFEEDRKDIIRIAIRYFLSEEYALFCHLIVPQIEQAVRQLVELGGGLILKIPKNGSGFEYMTLDELLRDPIVHHALGEDGAYYLRVVLTSPRGWNIRNELCHGILPPTHFGGMVALRLLHILFLLGSVRVKDSD